MYSASNWGSNGRERASIERGEHRRQTQCQVLQCRHRLSCVGSVPDVYMSSSLCRSHKPSSSSLCRSHKPSYTPTPQGRGREFRVRLDGVQQAKTHGRRNRYGPWLDEKRKGKSNCSGRAGVPENVLFYTTRRIIQV